MDTFFWRAVYMLVCLCVVDTLGSPERLHPIGAYRVAAGRAWDMRNTPRAERDARNDDWKDDIVRNEFTYIIHTASIKICPQRSHRVEKSSAKILRFAAINSLQVKSRQK